MPRVSAYRIAALAELEKQLRFAPPPTRIRQMDAAERLAVDLDPAQTYPESFVVYRITGFRPSAGAPEAMLVGQALRAELLTFIQRQSAAVALPPDHAGRKAVLMDDVAARLNVSRKTLQRYRREGLICHFIVGRDGVSRLACFKDALERFVDDHRPRLDRAAAFSRIDPAHRDRIIAQVRQWRQAGPLSFQETVDRLAKEHQRSTEAIRRLLRKHDRASGDPIFTEQSTLDEGQMELAYRAWRRGVPTARIVDRLGKTRATVLRAVNRRRADRLLSLDLSSIELATFKRADARAVILGSPAVKTSLDQPRWSTEVIELLVQIPVWETDEAAAQALAAAYNFLKRRARLALSALPAWPGAGEVDAIETDLRWAARLKRRLVAMTLSCALKRIESNLGRPLTAQPREQILSLLRLAAKVCSQTIESFDPGRRQQLHSAAALAMDLALAPLDLKKAASRAIARHAPGSGAGIDILANFCPWQAWLEPTAVERQDVERAGARGLLVAQRYGLAGSPPRTVADLAHEHGVTESAMTRRLGRARQ